MEASESLPPQLESETKSLPPQLESESLLSQSDTRYRVVLLDQANKVMVQKKIIEG